MWCWRTDGEPVDVVLDTDGDPVDVVLDTDGEPVDVVLDTDGEPAGAADEGVAGVEDGADDDAEGGAETPSAPSAHAIFARLRALGETSAQAGEDAEPAAGESAEASAELEAEEPSDVVSEEQEPSGADDGTDDAVAVDLAEEGDLVGAAREVAVGAIARSLKRMVVDEQGELLDALRRMGPRAIEGTIAAPPRPYARVVRGPLEDFASDIDVSIDDIDLQAAGKAVLSVLVEPVKVRLRELSTETDDVDELSAAVRAIYRESRSTRADEAAAEAFAKGWNDPVV